MRRDEKKKEEGKIWYIALSMLPELNLTGDQVNGWKNGSSIRGGDVGRALLLFVISFPSSILVESLVISKRYPSTSKALFFHSKLGQRLHPKVTVADLSQHTYSSRPYLSSNQS
jgi:hypothetical protein